MKVTCDHCGKDISKDADKMFEEYNCGKVTCPHCKKRQNRYISETDLLIYFGLSATVYFILITIIYALFTYLGINFFTILAILVLFILNYFIFKLVNRWIYTKAPLKKDIKNRIIDEDKDAVSKRLRMQFFAFIVVSLMMVGQPDLALPYFFLIFAFIIVVIIKIRLSLNNERKRKGNG